MRSTLLIAVLSVVGGVGIGWALCVFFPAAQEARPIVAPQSSDTSALEQRLALLEQHDKAYEQLLWKHSKALQIISTSLFFQRDAIKRGESIDPESVAPDFLRKTITSFGDDPELPLRLQSSRLRAKAATDNAK